MLRARLRKLIAHPGATPPRPQKQQEKFPSVLPERQAGADTITCLPKPEHKGSTSTTSNTSCGPVETVVGQPCSSSAVSKAPGCQGRGQTDGNEDKSMTGSRTVRSSDKATGQQEERDKSSTTSVITSSTTTGKPGHPLNAINKYSEEVKARAAGKQQPPIAQPVSQLHAILAPNRQYKRVGSVGDGPPSTKHRVSYAALNHSAVIRHNATAITAAGAGSWFLKLQALILCKHPSRLVQEDHYCCQALPGWCACRVPAG